AARSATPRPCRSRLHADRAGHPHLQHHDRRAAACGCRADRSAMSTSGEDKSPAVHCAEVVRTGDFARYASALFVPAPERRALLALYAFNAEICRVHTQVSQPLPGEIRLQWWRDMLAGDGHGGVEGNPVAAELLQAVRSYRLRVERLSRSIEEHRQ